MNTDAIECPICYENIDGVINSITTECGHKFHANCIMKNVAHNGFGCPCCRTKMAEECDDDGDSEESDGETDDDESETETDETPYSDYALLGLRLFTSRVDEEEPDIADIEMNYTMSFPGEAGLPTEEYVTEKLLEKGITMYQMVSTLMLDHIEYTDWQYADDTYENISRKIRDVINDFKAKSVVAVAEVS